MISLTRFAINQLFNEKTKPGDILVPSGFGVCLARDGDIQAVKSSRLLLRNGQSAAEQNNLTFFGVAVFAGFVKHYGAVG